MQSIPQISIIMPAYKAEGTISESIDSVIKQSFLDWELIIIFDGEKCEIPFDERIRVEQNDCNMGVSYSRNRGIELARGEYIAFLDADDTWREDKLLRQLEFIKEHNAQISYTASSFFGSSFILPAPFKLTYSELLKHNLMSCSSVMVKRELITKYPFPNRNTCHEDFSVWILIVREVGVAYGLNEPLLKYRLSQNSKSANRITSAIMTYNAYKESGYSFLSAFFMTVRYAVWSLKKRKMIYSGTGIKKPME